MDISITTTILSILEWITSSSRIQSFFKKKKENLYRDLVYELYGKVCPDIKFSKEVQYKNILDKKSKKKYFFKTGITDMELNFQGKTGVVEFKYNATRTKKEWDSAIAQCFVYGLYKFRDVYMVHSESKIEVIFYDENKQIIRKFLNDNRIYLHKFTPRQIGEQNTDTFLNLKKHTFNITPSFKVNTFLQFIKNHYEQFYLCTKKILRRLLRQN